MAETKRSSRLLLALLLVPLAAGIAFGVWMSVKAHEYYYPGELHLGFGGAQALDATFKVEKPGRYELSCRDDLGDLKFAVVSIDNGTPIPLERFGVLTQIFHTSGRRGYSFQIDSPGVYQLSSGPLPTGAAVSLGYTDTEAIARWSLGGMLVAAVCLGLTLLLVVKMIVRPKEAGAPRTEVPKPKEI
jgi:hypothetical protein